MGSVANVRQSAHGNGSVAVPVRTRLSRSRIPSDRSAMACRLVRKPHLYATAASRSASTCVACERATSIGHYRPRSSMSTHNVALRLHPADGSSPIRCSGTGTGTAITTRVSGPTHSRTNTFNEASEAANRHSSVTVHSWFRAISPQYCDCRGQR